MKKLKNNEKKIHSLSNLNNYGLLLLEKEKLLLLGTGNGKIEVLDPLTLDQKFSFSLNTNNFIWRIVQVDKRLMAASGGTRDIFILELNKNKKSISIKYRLSEHNQSIYGLTHCKTSYIASASNDQSLRIWNWKTKKCLHHFPGFGSQMCCVVYTGKYVCASGYTQKIAVYECDSTFKKVKKTKDVSTGANVWSMCVLENNKVAVGCEKSLGIYDLRSGSKLHSFGGINSWVYSILKVKTNQIVSASYDKNIMVFDLKKKKLLQSYSGTNPLCGLQISSKGFIYSVGYSRNLLALKSKYKNKIKFGKKLGNDEEDEDEEDEDEDEEDESDDESEVSDDDGMFDETEINEEEEKKAKNRSHNEFLERYDYLMNEDIFDVKIKFPKNQYVEFFKSFLNGSKTYENELEKLNEIAIEEKIEVNPEDIIKLFLGMKKVKVKPERLIDYYIFFKTMGMDSRAYLFCKKVIKITNLGMLLYLYKRVYERYEKNFQLGLTKSKSSSNFTGGGGGLDKYLSLDDEDEDENEDRKDGKVEKNTMQYATAFALSIFNQFKDREDEILNRKKLFKAFQREGLLMKLKEHKVMPIKNHDEFAKMKAPKNFAQAFLSDLKELYKNKKFWNITLKSNDEKKFKAHFEILILKSNFFKAMASFGGQESEELKGGELHLEFLDGTLTKETLNYIYTGDLETKDVNVLFRLLAHSNMYFELNFAKCVVKNLKKVTRSIIQRSNIYSFLRNFMGYFNDENMIKGLIHYWAEVGGISVDKIFAFINKERSNTIIKSLEERIKTVEKENEIWIEKFKQMKKKVEGLLMENK